VTLFAHEESRDGAQVVVGARGQDRVALRGVLREPEVGAWLGPLFRKVHDAAVAAQVARVALDLRDLEYGNAAVWKCLVFWLKLAREDAQARYKLVILTARKHRWQEIGMSALRVFGGDRLEVSVEDGAGG
jgi:hypothetical protein